MECGRSDFYSEICPCTLASKQTNPRLVQCGKQPFGFVRNIGSKRVIFHDVLARTNHYDARSSVRAGSMESNVQEETLFVRPL